MPRGGWGAKNPISDRVLRFHGPVDYVVITQTARVGGQCVTHDDCCEASRKEQKAALTNEEISKCTLLYCFILPDCLRSILLWGNVSSQIHLISPGCPRPNSALTVHKSGLKHRSSIHPDCLMK